MYHPIQTLRAAARRGRNAFTALPAPARALGCGVALLAGILAGGAITAYGGLLIVLLLWAICTGALWQGLGFCWRTAFPGQRMRDDRAFCRAFAIGAAVGLAVILARVL